MEMNEPTTQAPTDTKSHKQTRPVEQSAPIRSNKFAVLREDTNVGESPSTHGKGKSTFVFGESSRAKTTLNKNSPPNRHPPPPAEGVPPLDNVRHIARAQMINRSGAQESPRCRGMSSKRGGRASSRENPNAAKGSGHVGLTSVFQFVSTVPAAAGGGGSNQFGQVQSTSSSFSSSPPPTKDASDSPPPPIAESAFGGENTPRNRSVEVDRPWPCRKFTTAFRSIQ
nr:hypothetical protein Iba_chr10bCG1360 [Ipomoea batatas]